ncbi:hypothetical protein NPA31_007300 [Aurantimonas sp. MSK8Z-1]|uniref:hypothetical protein n=1 Tax=Mangrovibrevibacter kandeliae TaxID=2968473 RepID=UPI0021195F08|nr:hypothetical protein [Aurantimonas sp. MSK8Z-1]MCW4114768.1 hypothetical protein [Aurantimonas sp. MSK8Z-1]
MSAFEEFMAAYGAWAGTQDGRAAICDPTIVFEIVLPVCLVDLDAVAQADVEGAAWQRDPNATRPSGAAT